jgi:hypothetical protein
MSTKGNILCKVLAKLCTDGIIHDRSNIEKGLSLHWGRTRGIAAKISLRSSLKAVLINQLVNTQAALRSDASSS